MKRTDRLLRGFTMIGVLIVFSASPSIPDDSASHPLAWKDCVSIALAHNPDLASSRNALAAGKAGYSGSFNGLMPQVTVSNNYSNSYSGNANANEATNWQGQGSIALNIYNAGQIANIKASKSSLEQSETNLKNTSSSLRFNLRKSFLQELFGQTIIEVSGNILKMRKKEADLVTFRYESGTESKGNMLRAKAQLLQAEADLAQARRDLRTEQKSLDRQLGLEEFSSLTVTGTILAMKPPPLPGDEMSLAESRPDVLLQKAVVQSAEAGLQQSRSSLWPSLTGSYSRFVNGGSEFPSSQYGWSFSGLLSYPLFGAGPTAAYYSITAAKNNLERSRQDLRSIREQAVVDIETSWSGFASAYDQAKVQDALLEASRQRNDEADIRYASGLMTFDNWEIIASDRVNQERQTVQAHLNNSIAQAAWESSLGIQLEDQ